MEHYAGIDVSLELSSVCIVDTQGKIVKEAKVAIEVEPGTAVREAVTNYLKVAIAEDWPAMEKGKISLGATHALSDAYATTGRFNPSDRRETVLLTEMLRQLDVVAQARRARYVMASGNVPEVIWLGLFGGAVITIGFTFFFGSENLRAQSTMTGTLSILIFSALLIIIAIDYPFAGNIKVDQMPFPWC